MANGGFAEGMQGGMQLGLGMFNAMQNAAYQQQLMRNADENQEMRKQDQALKQQELAATQYQNRFTRNKFAIDNADKMPEDTVLEAFNELNHMIDPNARNMNKLDVETFKTDGRAYLDRVKGAANNEAANLAIDEYRAKSATHPILNRIGQAHIKRLEDVRDRRQLYNDMEKLGFRDRQWVEKYVGDGDPTVIRKMVENNDTRSMIMTQYSQDVLQRHENGENVQPAELGNAIAWTHVKAGGELKEGGKKIFEGFNRAQMHQEAVNGFKEAQTELSPIFRASELVKPEDVQALTDAKNEVRTIRGYYGGTVDGVPDGTIYGGLASVKHENDAVAKAQQILEKYPQLTQTLKQIGPKADEQAHLIKSQLEQLERDKKATKAAVTLPNRTEHLERLDQQIKLKKSQLVPWQTVAHAYQNPESPEAIKGLLSVSGKVKREIDVNEVARVNNLTEAEKNAKIEIDMRRQEIHVNTVGPAEAEMELFKYIGENPNATDQQIIGKAAEFGQAYKKQHGLAPDMNKVVESVIAKRARTEDDTPSKISPADAPKVALMIQGKQSIADYKTLITKPDGTYDRSLIASQEIALPWTDGKTADTIIMNVQDGTLRLESGAAVTETEFTRNVRRSRILFTDPDATITKKLENIARYYETTLRVMDPHGKIEGRAPKAPKLTREQMLSGERTKADKTAEGYDAWKRKNPDGNVAQYMAQE